MVSVQNGFPVAAPNGELFVVDLEKEIIIDRLGDFVAHFSDEDEAVEMIENGSILEADFVFSDLIG